jgi:hypothetical protein
MVHIKEECKRGRERQGDHGERNGMEAGKKEGKWGGERRFDGREDGRKRIMRKRKDIWKYAGQNGSRETKENEK